MSTNLRMVVTGGGTGGHFFPAQTLRNSLMIRGINVKYIGSRYGIESTLLNNNDNDITLLVSSLAAAQSVEAIGNKYTINKVKILKTLENILK